MKRITLTMLAEMIRDGFADQDRRMSERFDRVDDRFNKLEHRIDKGEYFQNGHENRISHLEDDMRVVKKRLDI